MRKRIKEKILKKDWIKPELVLINLNKTQGGGPDPPPEDYYGNTNASP